MPKLTLAAFMLLLSAFAARADELYTFTFTPGIVETGTGIESFTFSLTVPTFITTGESPAFTPFTVTDGTNSVTMTKDLFVASGGFACYEFGTATNSNLGTCTGGQSSPDGGDIFWDVPGSLPVEDGDYSLSGGVVFSYSDAGLDATFGNVALVVSAVSAVPEPASVVLLAIVAAMVGLVLRRRRGALG